MNSDFLFQRARAFAQRVLVRAGRDRDRQIEAAFVLALGRRPEADDWDLARSFFESTNRSRKEDIKKASDRELPQALLHFCHALLSLNEFAYPE